MSCTKNLHKNFYVLKSKIPAAIAYFTNFSQFPFPGPLQIPPAWTAGIRKITKTISQFPRSTSSNKTTRTKNRPTILSPTIIQRKHQRKTQTTWNSFSIFSRNGNTTENIAIVKSKTFSETQQSIRKFRYNKTWLKKG